VEDRRNIKTKYLLHIRQGKIKAAYLALKKAMRLKFEVCFLPCASLFHPD